MPRVERGGIAGESYKAEWLPGALKQEHEAMMAKMEADMPPLPKGVRMPSMPEFHGPWTSIGQAPTEEQLREAAYGGSA